MGEPQPAFVWVELVCGHQMYQRSDLDQRRAYGVRLPFWPCETCGARDEQMGVLWMDDGTGPRLLSEDG